MKDDKVVDYFQAMREFDKAQGIKPDGFDIPLKSSLEDGGVDYLAVSREYERYLASDQSDVIRNEKREIKQR